MPREEWVLKQTTRRSRVGDDPALARLHLSDSGFDSWRAELVEFLWLSVMTSKQRSSANQVIDKKSRMLDASVGKARQGDIAATNILANDGRRRHATKEEYEEAHAAAFTAANHRRSQSYLDFVVLHQPGCSADSCVFAHSGTQQECPCGEGPPHYSFLPGTGASMLQCMIQGDHTDASTKEADMTTLQGNERVEEWLKTQPLCWFHHLLHTIEQQEESFGSTLDDLEPDSDRSRLIEHKLRTGC